tara:strand:- start:1311 stop:2150 length:840 start_codon:yes stop_codon:yes gene_type:complete
MSSSNVNQILPKNAPIESFQVGKPKQLPNGVAKMVYLQFDKENFTLQLPEMYAPFGKSFWKNDDGGTTKNWLDLSFRDIDSRTPLQVTKKLIEDIDLMVMNEALKNSFAWFGKKYTSLEVLKALFTPSIKYPRDKVTGEVTDKWPPTFKVSLPQKNGEFSFETYNKKRQLISIDDIQTKGSRITPIIQCGGIWIAGGKFGITWRAVQLLILPYSKITGFSIVSNPEDLITPHTIDDDEDDEDDEDEVDKVDEITAKVNTNSIDDDEDDEDEDDDDDDAN